MNDKTIIALVGMPGSGKSSCVDHLTKRGWPKVYFGGVVVDEAKQRFGEANEKNERIVREELRAKEGMGAVAIRVIPKIDQFLIDHDTVIADGLYSWSEYKILREKYGDQLVIIALASGRKARHQRLAGRDVRPLTEEEAASRDYAEIENSEKGGPIANADYFIVNDGTVDEMLAQLDKIVDSL
jgi:dephospho-CoA kinase